MATKRNAIKVHETGSARYQSVFMEYTADWEMGLDPIYVITVGKAYEAGLEHDAKIEKLVADIRAKGHKIEELYDGEEYFGHTVICCEAEG